MSGKQQPVITDKWAISSMKSCREMRLGLARSEQQAFEAIFPIGSLVVFKEAGKWKGPVPVVKNHFGPVDATHEPMVMVMDGTEEVFVRSVKNLRPYMPTVLEACRDKADCVWFEVAINEWEQWLEVAL